MTCIISHSIYTVPMIHVRITSSARDGLLDATISTIETTTLEVVSVMKLHCARVLLIDNAILIETTLPLVYLFIPASRVPPSVLRVVTRGPIINFACTSRPYAIDVLYNYYLFDENSTILDAGDIYPRDPYYETTYSLERLSLHTEQLCTVDLMLPARL